MLYPAATVNKHRIFLAVALLLIGQLASLLHSHDISQTTHTTDHCILCLIGNAGADASPYTPSLFNHDFSHEVYFATVNRTAKNDAYITPYNSRAPPFFS